MPLIKLKPVHWRKLQPAPGSVWASFLSEPEPTPGRAARRAAELATLERLFANKPAKEFSRSAAAAAPTGSGNGSPTMRERPELCSSKRAQNISICLKKVTPLPFERMAAAVCNLNVGRDITWEDALALKQLSPVSRN